MLKICADTNAGERPIVEALQRMCPDGVVSCRRLDCADFVVATASRRMLVERKSTSDFASSIVDGRLKEQVCRMVNAATHDSEVDTKVVVLLCGSPPVHNFSFHGLTAKSFYGMMNWLQFKKGVVVVWCASGEQNVASRLLQLGVKLLEDTPEGDDSTPNTFVTGGRRRRSENRDDVESSKRACLQGVAGVSASVADAVFKEFPSIAKLASVSIPRLSKVDVGKRKLGSVVATRIVNVLNE